MVPEVPPQPEQTAAKGEEIEDPEKAEELSVPPQRERLMEGPQPYDVPVPMEERKVEEDPKPKPAERPEKGNSEDLPPKEEVDESPKPASAPPDDPAFRGFQRKAAIRGSISRTGRSALAVADTPEGRYQALISRAVEQEWQRNCARHRDFITPGYLTVRFFVEASGKVKSVQFVGEMETGQVQKGFTLSSIRDAAIPAMPAELRKELDGEPMELLFNFYF
jgi:outer membrane biosynthesis protein TonB